MIYKQALCRQFVTASHINEGPTCPGKFGQRLYVVAFSCSTCDFCNCKYWKQWRLQRTRISHV